jgi:hypothetical protein
MAAASITPAAPTEAAAFASAGWSYKVWLNLHPGMELTLK